MADIFISYAREDQPLATVLADQLEQAGWDVWWDDQPSRFHDCGGAG